MESTREKTHGTINDCKCIRDSHTEIATGNRNYVLNVLFYSPPPTTESHLAVAMAIYFFNLFLGHFLKAFVGQLEADRRMRRERRKWSVAESNSGPCSLLAYGLPAQPSEL